MDDLACPYASIILDKYFIADLHEVGLCRKVLVFYRDYGFKIYMCFSGIEN